VSARRALAAVAAAALARAVLGAVRAGPSAPALERKNFRGGTVSLAGGPAMALAAAGGAAVGAGSRPAAAAALAAGLGAGAVGLYDDLVGGRPEHAAKGFQGHLTALRQGRVTSGLVKVAGIGAASLAAAALLSREPARRPGPGGVLHTLLGAGVIAGTANLVNLLDLRPGRAAKAGLAIGVPLLPGPGGGLAAGPVAAAAALLPADLNEEIMLGDCGANALGAQLGVALAARTGPLGRAGVLAVLAALTAASERVSFTQVIERTPGLRELDAWGRRSAPR
jgi:UDP-N-acetylmuramyl pentapeptide phosphotransferase/UDP-N-acetylglucosamine-1-phosphate transferase